jgi:hypothetical protein
MAAILIVISFLEAPSISGRRSAGRDARMGFSTKESAMEFDYRGYTVRIEEYEDETNQNLGRRMWHATIDIKGHVDTWKDRFPAEREFATRADAEFGAAQIAREYLDRKLGGQSTAAS